jgi:TRAP-type transport system small permease protein
MWLKKAAEALAKVTCPVSGILHSVGAGVLALIMFLTTADVVLRYAFNRPIVGSYDLTEYMMAIMVSFGLAYCAFLKGHVRIDLIVGRLPPRVQAGIDSVTGLLGFLLFGLITWQSFVYMQLLFASGLESTVLLIPRYPFAGLVCLGSAFMALILLSDFLEFLAAAVKR